MKFVVGNLTFSLALSMDGLAMGLSYGLRKIKAFIPLIVICFFGGSNVFSMTCGKMCAFFLSTQVAVFLGGLILIGVGFSIIGQQYFLAKSDCLVLNVLREPIEADLNRSGVIDLKEAYVVGLALALDALGAGLGAAMSGYSLVFTPLCVGIAEFVMLNLGIFVGRCLNVGNFKKTAVLVPGNNSNFRCYKTIRFLNGKTYTFRNYIQNSTWGKLDLG